MSPELQYTSDALPNGETRITLEYTGPDPKLLRSTERALLELIFNLFEKVSTAKI